MLFGKFRKFDHFCLIFLLFFGTALQSLTMIRSGLFYDFGMGFWGANGHDGIWHLALANQVLQGFPPPHPTFAGEVLTNYHYFYDLLLASLSQMTRVPTINLYFQILPVVLAFLLGLLSFLVGLKMSKNFWVGFWFAFLNYFAGSFGYLVTFFRSREIGGESLFWSMQSISTQINPPFSLSLVMILLVFYLLLSVKKYKAWKIIGLSLIFGLLINVKVYAGLLILPGLFVYSLVSLRKKEFSRFWIFLFSSFISFGLFFLINRGSGSLLVFEPFWFVHTLIESQDRLYLPQLALARYTLVSSGGYKRLILVELIGLGLFFIGNVGTRILGLFSLVERVRNKKLNEVEIFFLVGGVISLLVPLLFIQKGTSWNTIQFFYYFLFFLNFYAALTFARIIGFKNNLIRYLTLIFIIFLTIPTTYSSLKGYFGFPPPAALTKNEVEALVFLKRQPKKVVLTYPYSPYVKRDLRLKEPLPLYAYETTAYVSAFSDKEVYLEDEMNLLISDYDLPSRKKNVEKFLETDNKFEARGFLLDYKNKIDYLYLLDRQNLKYSVDDLGLKLIYNREGVKIFEVIK